LDDPSLLDLLEPLSKGSGFPASRSLSLVDFAPKAVISDLPPVGALSMSIVDLVITRRETGLARMGPALKLEMDAPHGTQISALKHPVGLHLLPSLLTHSCDPVTSVVNASACPARCPRHTLTRFVGWPPDTPISYSNQLGDAQFVRALRPIREGDEGAPSTYPRQKVPVLMRPCCLAQ
jgi:hypothetical protein